MARTLISLETLDRRLRCNLGLASPPFLDIPAIAGSGTNNRGWMMASVLPNRSGRFQASGRFQGASAWALLAPNRHCMASMVSASILAFALARMDLTAWQE
jgi:hypothetical protein